MKDTKKKKVITVSPDYMSSGLWSESGVTICPPKYLNTVATTLLALWHDKWELLFDDSWLEGFKQPNRYVMKKWKQQGETLVNYLNFQANCEGKKHTYVLDVDWEMTSTTVVIIGCGGDIDDSVVVGEETINIHTEGVAIQQ
jgi:hypothetical protein